MSVSDLLSPLPGKDWLNASVNSISTNSANLNNGPITNVSSINGQPLPPLVFDSNPVNIILKPGSSPQLGSNIVQSWSQVLSKASQINVNQILNIYVDDSIVSPVLLNQSYNFKGRTNLYPIRYISTSAVNCLIPDGVLISNLSFIEGPIVVNCDSITGPCLEVDNGAILGIENGARIKLTATAAQSAIQLNNNSMILCSSSGSQLDNSLNTGLGVISLVNNATLDVALISNPLGTGTLPVSCADATCNLNLLIDASNNANISIPLYTLGATNFVFYDNGAGVTYDNTIQSPALLTNPANVQDAIDSVKSQYLPLSGGTMSGAINMGSQNISAANLITTTDLVYSNATSGSFYSASSGNAILSDALGNSFTTTTNSIRVISIGKLKVVNYWILYSSQGSATPGSNVRLSLPSTIANNDNRPSGFFGNSASLAGGLNPMITCSGVAGNNYMEFFSLDPAGGASTQLTTTNFAASGELQLTFIYESV